MKIVFMGTPDFAVPSLQAILDSGHMAAGVFTQPDKPKGRGHALTPPPVKVLAERYQIPVFQPRTLRAEETEAQIRKISPDLIVVVAYGKILPPEILKIPLNGCVNVHASLLPKYRGAGPIQWSILNGETVTGVTTMYMGEGLDTGDILLQKETAIGENETAGELYDRLSEIGATLLMETIGRMEQGNLAPVRQDDEQATYAPMLTKEMSLLDFSCPAEKVHNKIRGLSPWPCAQAQLGGKRLKIYKSEIVHTIDMRQAVCGSIVDGKEFIVACGEGSAIRLLEVQGEGARRMSGAEFLRGHPVSLGERLSPIKQEEKE